MAEAAIPHFKTWNDIYFTGYAGIRLYARHYAGERAMRPLVCLPDLTDNSRAFEPLADALSNHALGPRTVYTLDFRGRGNSENDPDWQNYTPLIEMLDLLNFMSLKRLHRPVILASGWAGMITMALATLYPGMLGPVILSDTGPKLETTGLLRVQAFIGRLPTPTSWRKAAALLKEMNKNHFTDLSDDDWLKIAHQQFNEKDGRPAEAYDPNLEKSLMLANAQQGAPEMWNQFKAMSHVPILAIRGENSDVITKTTLEQMYNSHNDLQIFTVANEGHCPRLDDDLSIERIRLFLDKCDRLNEDEEDYEV